MRIAAILLLGSCARVVGHLSTNLSFMSNNKKLYETLFTDYYSFMSPYNTASISNNSDESPAEVEIALGYAHLTHVKWHDARLAWHPDEHANIQYIYVNSNQLWIPEISACESSKFMHISEDRARKVRVLYTGHIEYYFISHASFICTFDANNPLKTRTFPFDTHWCFYCFTIPRYESSELVLRGYDLPWKVVMDTNEWRMQPAGFRYDTIEEEGYPVEDRSVIYFEMLLERRGTFWVTLVIVPSYLIGLMILLGLFFSSEEPNLDTSVNLGLISFTSMMFIIGILADSLPKSELLSNLGWYILIELLIRTFAVLSVFFQTALNRWMRRGVKWCTGGVFRTYSTSSEEHSDVNEEKRRLAPVLYRLLNFIVERVVVVGTAHSSLFFVLHTANVLWLLLSPLLHASQRPLSLHLSSSGRI